MTLHESQVLHGPMRFATGFYAGRSMYQVCAEVTNLGYSALKSDAAAVKDFCDYAMEVISQCVPRTISTNAERLPVLIFTDGSWEGERAGLGLVFYDRANGFQCVMAGFVPDVIIKHWKGAVGEQLISQIELYALVATKWLFAERLCNRRTIFWVDNESARYSLIKGVSPSWTMQRLTRLFYDLDLRYPVHTWIERVPSSSNPADGPSRGRPQEALSIFGVSQCQQFQHPTELLEAILKAGH